MKSKIVKRILAASLVTAMTVGLAGCGTTDAPAADDAVAGDDAVASDDAAADAEEVSPYPVLKDADGNVYDLGGMEIIIRDWWSADEERVAKNAFEEAQFAYQDWAMETYNFKMKQVSMSTWDSVPEDFLTFANNGGDENYVFVVRQGAQLLSAMNNGLLYDLATLDCLDFSEEKWSSGMHELIAKGDSIYAMNPLSPEARTGLYFNKRILEEAGINPNDLYTWQENMEWTWEKFAEVCDKVQRDIDNDGAIDIYAITGQRAVFFSAAVYSNGGDYVGKDENGQYVNKLESAETLEALNWAVDMLKKHDLPMEEGANWDKYVSDWIAGKAAFCTEDGYRGNQEFAASKVEDDWGFVCFPMGPQMDDYTNVYVDNPYVLPACYDADRAWKIAFALNVWTEPVPGFENSDNWKSTYYNNYSDTEAVDYTIARMLKNGKVTYNDMITGISMGEDLLWGLGWSEETPAQAGERLRNSWNQYIAEANK